MKKLKPILIIAGMIVCFILARIITPTDDPTPVAVESSVVATDAPVPIVTPFIATNTPVPTKTPFVATNTPVPTVTPTVTQGMDATPMQDKAGFISLSEVKDNFAEAGFEFDDPIITDQTTWGGVKAYKTSLTLIGVDDRLEYAELSYNDVAFPEDDTEASLSLLVTLLSEAIPEWDNEAEWFAEAFPKAVESGRVETVKFGKKIELIHNNGYTVIAVSID